MKTRLFGMGVVTDPAIFIFATSFYILGLNLDLHADASQH